MEISAYNQRLLKLLEGCDNITAVVRRFQEHGVPFRPYPLEALFGRGVTAATPELLLDFDDGEVFLRDVHGRNCMIVVRRTGDVMYLQGEYAEPATESAG
jgi:hypothetical protein